MNDVRRDRWSRYLVVPPGGGKPVGYTRATTVAKALDDGGGLIPWKATATMVGALRRPGLMARWQALMAQHPDPWYGSIESKNTAKRLVEESAEAGGSTDKADMGTALHAIVEQFLRDPAGPTPLLQAGMQADIDAFKAAIGVAGLTFDCSLIEAMIVLDGHKVAGMSDQLRVTVPGVGDVVGDLKTSQDLKYSWQAIAIQLAIYANADNVYLQGAVADGSDDRRLPMPAVSRDVALVIHLPSGQGRCQLYLVDIATGWHAFEHAMWVRSWRGRDGLATVHTAATADPPPAFDEPAEQIVGEVASPPPVTSPTSPIPDFDAPCPPPAQSTGAPAPDGGQPPVEPARPTPSPPPFNEPIPPAGTNIGDRTLQELHRLLGDHPDDGGPGDDGAYDVLQHTYSQLPKEAKDWFAQLTEQSIRHNVSFHSSGARTVRRFEIIRGLTELAAAGATDDESLRCVLAGQPLALIGRDIAHDPRLEPGHLLGSLDVVYATEFARRAALLAAGTVPAAVDETTGRVVLDFSTLAATAA